MEYQTGPDALLRPIEIHRIVAAPVDSYVTIKAAGAREAYESWTMEIVDKKGIAMYYGPYYKDIVTIPGKSILGSQPEGDFKVTMIGRTKAGKTVKKNATVHVVLWTPPKTEEMLRYSILYEFNDSKAIHLYAKYLTETVLPGIPNGAKVIIHGYTDIIGDEAHNEKLSLARANDVKEILEQGILKAGRNDASFEVYGFGEDTGFSPFENKYPEERFYNRTVLIDIIPRSE